MGSVLRRPRPRWPHDIRENAYVRLSLGRGWSLLSGDRDRSPRAATLCDLAARGSNGRALQTQSTRVPCEAPDFPRLLALDRSAQGAAAEARLQAEDRLRVQL